MVVTLQCPNDDGLAQRFCDRELDSGGRKTNPSENQLYNT